MKRTNCLKLTLVSFIHSFIHLFIHSFIHSFIHLFIHSSSVYMALSLLLHERFDFVQLLQKRVSKDKPYFWLALSVRFYDLNELFMRGCSFPISSISCLHEPYRQNMRIMRFRLCPDGYGPPRLAKINNCILVFSTSIFRRMPRKNVNLSLESKKFCVGLTD